MQFFIYIIVLTIGIIIGKSLRNYGRRTSVIKEHMSELSKEAKIAINKRTDKRKSRIMELFRTQEKITNDDVEDMFCISDSTARNYLNELEHEGKLKQIGNTGRGVYYTPIIQ